MARNELGAMLEALHVVGLIYTYPDHINWQAEDKRENIHPIICHRIIIKWDKFGIRRKARGYYLINSEFNYCKISVICLKKKRDICHISLAD